MMTPASSTGEPLYLQTFRDGWPAELLLVVPIAGPREAIAEYVASSWRAPSESLQFTVRALTFDEAAQALCRSALA